MLPRISFDKNLVVDPGFGFTKLVTTDADGGFKKGLFPSVIALYSHKLSGILDKNTIKVSIAQSTRNGIEANACRLVGNQAKQMQGEAGKLYAFMFDKTDKDIILWTLLAALSKQIPAGLKNVKISDGWVVCSLQDLREKENLINAIAGKHDVIFERLIDGHKDVVSVEIEWSRDKIHVVQEASGGIEYVKEYELYKLDADPTVQYGSISIGVGTFDLVRQTVAGDILQISSHPLGLSSLAKLISENGEMRSRCKNITVDKVLQAIHEGGSEATFVYGKGSQGVDFKDIYAAALKVWLRNIFSKIQGDWGEELNWIDQIFYYGGGVKLQELQKLKTEQSFFFTGTHDPQFVDVIGFRIWAEKNLF